MLDNVKNIYYRGYIKSCNYTCEYCPFSKTAASQRILDKDREALINFINKLSNMCSVETVFIIPYGEAMLHNYYYSALARISRLSHVKRVGIQTNLSFKVEAFVRLLADEGADISKLVLWCSFHKSQTSEEEFMEQCRRLSSAGINYTVGMVGDYKNIDVMKRLKAELPHNTYLWINAKEGMGVKYKPYEINEFTHIDPMFNNEVSNIKADFSACNGGEESIFVNAEGDIYPCILSKVKYGNLYTGECKLSDCRQRLCSCYLAYSLRRDLEELKEFMKVSKVLRFPYLTGNN